MKIINSTNRLKTEISVNWTEQIGEDGFTEFRYTCQCGKKSFDIYLDKGMVSKKRKTCKDCKRTNIVPCRVIRR